MLKALGFNVEVGKTYIDTGDSYVPVIKRTLLNVFVEDHEIFLRYHSTFDDEEYVVSLDSYKHILQDWVLVE